MLKIINFRIKESINFRTKGSTYVMLENLSQVVDDQGEHKSALPIDIALCTRYLVQ